MTNSLTNYILLDMKKAVLLFTTAVITLYAQSQEKEFQFGKLTKDTLFLKNGAKFGIGQKVQLGYGSTANKDFEFVHLSPWSIAGPLKLGSGWANMTMVVKEFKTYQSKKLGEKVYLVLKGGNLSPYWCDIIAAIDQKEVIVDGINNAKTEVKSQLSLADELKKLKDLYDSGAITKEEYEAAKKKLLEN
jgi:hypothetical protein